MEVNQLLNAIIEVSQAVARIPCAPQDKNETLEKIKDLFSIYTAISQAFVNISSSSNRREETLVKAENRDPSCASPNLDVGKMQEQIQNMDEKLRTMECKLNRLENQQQTSSESRESISDLRSQVVSQGAIMKRIGETQDDLHDRVTRIENMSNDLGVLQDRIHTINDIVDEGTSSFGSEMLKIHQEIADLEGSFNNKGSKETVAFLANACTNRYKYVTGDVIQFQRVALNLHNCYDPSMGIFTSKFKGLYLFCSSINTNSEGSLEAAIVHNSTEISRFGTPLGKDLQSGTSVLLLLNPGDTVCVKIWDGASGPGVEVGGGFSNFIGYRID